MARTLQYMYLQRAIGTIVVPVWPSSTFWPLIERFYFDHIEDYYVANGSDALVHGRNTNSLLGSRYFKGYVAALRCNFTGVTSGKRM